MSLDINPKIQLNYILNKAEDLPCFPLVVLQTYNLCSNPHTKPKDVEDLVRSDQALSAKLLRIVNSSYFGYAQEIEDMHQTIAILGLNGIKEVVMVSAVDQLFHHEGCEKLWKQSIESSIAVKHLFAHHDKEFKDHHFLTCLMHNIGRAFFIRNFENFYNDTISLSNLDHILAFEREVFGVSHRQLGGSLAKRWNFPPELVKGIEGDLVQMDDHYLTDLAIKLTYLSIDDVERNQDFARYFEVKEKILEETEEKIEALQALN